MKGPGEQREENNRIVTAGLSHFKKPRESTDIERLILTCEERIKVVRAHARAMVTNGIAAGQDTPSAAFKKMLFEDLQDKFLGLSLSYNLDELRLLMAIQWTSMVIKEVV